MRPWLVAALGLLIAALTGVALVNAQGPSRQQLRTDIAEIDAEIAEASHSAGLYAETSLIGTSLKLRLAVLRTTRAMLDQKRRAWLRGVDLSYFVRGREIRPDLALAETLKAKALEAEMKAKEARAKAELYSGGLIQSLALVEEQSNLVTLAAIRQRIALAELGFAFPDGSTESGGQNMPAIGQTVGDGGAI